MRRITGPKWLVLGASLLFLGMLGCGETMTLRSAGEACSSDDSCEANLCYTNVCLEPAADDDLDGLTNALEAQLKTDPLLADSDGDGLPDGFEVGSPESPKDEDGDEVIDAIESLIADEDEDCIPDQKDDKDAPPPADLLEVADKACCCGGSCSDAGVSVSPALCTPDAAGALVLSCPTDMEEANTDGDALPDVCDPCPQDITNTCDLAPHSVTISPVGPSQELTPVLSGVALYGDKIVVSEGSCEGERVGETPRSGGSFEVEVKVAPNATSALYTKTVDAQEQTIGCSGPLSYTHDDIAPDKPVVTRMRLTKGALTLVGSAEPGSTLNLYAGDGCEGEPTLSFEVGEEGTFEVALPLAPPWQVQVTLSDPAGNTTPCSPAEAEDPPSCGPDSDITGDQLAGTSLRKALVGCTSEGYCGGDATLTQCSLCVTDALIEGEASLETSCTLCVVRIVPFISACLDSCLGGESEDVSCLECACAQEEGRAEVVECGAGALCGEGSAPSPGTIDPPYPGATCVDPPEGWACTLESDSYTPGCIAVTGGISAAATADGQLYSADVCHQSGGDFESVGVIVWPRSQGGPIEAMDLTMFSGTTGITHFGQSVAALGKGPSGAPLLAGMGPGDSGFNVGQDTFSDDVEFYDRPVILADTLGWLYTLGQVKGAGADRLTLLVKPTTSEGWVYAPGVAFGKNADGSTGTDFVGVDMVASPPSDLHAFHWRGPLASSPNNPAMGFYYRLDLSEETVESPSALAAGSAVTEPIEYFKFEYPFGLLLEESVARIAIATEPQGDGSTRSVPHVAHWFGNASLDGDERLLVLRREGPEDGEGTWTPIYTYVGQTAKSDQDTCSGSPIDAQDTCSFTLERQRLLDIAGVESGIVLLISTRLETCTKSASCGAGPCTWTQAACEPPDGAEFSARLQHVNTEGFVYALDDIQSSDNPITAGSVVIDPVGGLHVVVASTQANGAVEIQYLDESCGGPCGGP